MVSALALNQSGFSSPLLSQPFSLFSLANRAVALLTVFSVKRMAVFAVGTHCVSCSNRRGVYKTVFFSSNHSEVCDIDAMSIFANMVNDHSVGDIALGSVVRNPMGATTFFSEIKRSITVFIERTVPKMTATFFMPLAIEPFQLCLCYIHTPIVPCNALRRKGEDK